MASVTEAAASGNRLDTLVALRDSIARAIDSEPSGRDVAALSKRLMEVMDEIEALPDGERAPTAFEALRAEANGRAS
ncbi:MAG: hypothetical protein IJ092_03110 [Atopobiaceae bacterium]|nr:hypothetical protein [Atopobiaceae bacterium]